MHRRFECQEAAQTSGITIWVTSSMREPNKLRWGNDFSTPDPVHIDNGLNLNHERAFRDKLMRLWA